VANLNKVMLIGRLTKDPEVRTFSNGGKVAKIRFAVNNRKKNQQTGQWEDDPVYLDVDAFNRETGRKLADLVEQYLKKGHQCYIEGNLVLDQWEKDGQKRSQIKIVMQDVQFLEPRADGGAPRTSAPARKPADAGYAGGYDEPEEGPSRPAEDDNIPF
jgi:single-strand DNA-binding protein